MRRRAFLQSALALVAPQIPAPGVIDIGGTKQLFVDDLLLAEASRISKFQYRPEKYAKN
jgi:hypothetical protein